MGKTRLALQVAAQMLESFAQGLYFVELDRIKSPDLVVQAVAQVLPITQLSNEDPKARVLAYLRDKAILLIMDNFEHVLEGAGFVQEILSVAPRVQILATSRVRLNLTSETVFNVGGLAIGAAAVEQNSAIQLFVQSAKRTRPQFELTAEVLPAVTRICRLVEGMPLAIVLAAAWINTLPVPEICDEIEKSIDMLETEQRDVPDRQRSVRAVIESSWSQIDATLQNQMKRLSVFRGGFTRAAAQEVAGATLRSLSQLVEKALLRRDPDSGRYSMHELLRQYAEEQPVTSSDLEQTADEAHATFFADWMRARWTDLRGTRQKPALMEIEADLDNIRIAWNYWIEKQTAHRLLQFVDALWLFFEIKGSIKPAFQLFDAAAEKLVSTETDIVCARAEIRTRNAWFTALLGQPEEGLRIAEENIALLRKHNRDIGVFALAAIPVNAIWMNKIELVSAITEEMMEQAKDGDGFERVWASVWWSYGLFMQNQVERATRGSSQLAAISKELDNPFAWAWAEFVPGVAAVARGDTVSAKTHYLSVIQQAERINFVRMIMICSEVLCSLALKEGEIEQAQSFALKCLRINREVGQTREMLAALRDLASVEYSQGNLRTALEIVGVILNHPAAAQNTLSRTQSLRDEAENLRAQIETQLDPPVYKAAWEAGQRQRLEVVVEKIFNPEA
jgi:predicted ATPase